jgi:HlyD family secretion protein
MDAALLHIGERRHGSARPLTHDPAAAKKLLAQVAGFFAGDRARLAGLAILILVIAGAGVGWRYLRGGNNTGYITAPVATGTVSRTVTATGTVNPVLTIIVGSYVSGPIQQLYCDYNTRVRQGQICAKIDPRPYQTIVDQNKANLAVARAQLEKDRAHLAYAKLNSERLAGLAKTQAVSQDAADNARSVYNQAAAQIAYDEATIQQREAQLEASLVNLEYTNITAPVDGTVVSRNVTMGQTVASSFQTPTLFLIATDLTKMQIDTNVSESDIGGVEPGDRATFTVDAFPHRTFEGSVAQIRQSPQTIQNVVTFDVVISVANDDLALKPGFTAATKIIVDERRNVICVPNQALRYRPAGAGFTPEGASQAGNDQVWVLRNGEPVPTTVKTGLDDGSNTEILSGLKPGEQVIVGERVTRAKAKIPRPQL